MASKSLCGLDLYLYELLGPYMHAGDIVAHEAMGVVQEVGSSVFRVKMGDRVVIPFQRLLRPLLDVRTGLQSQCETTQVRSHGKEAEFLGYSGLYGPAPGGRAEYLRVTHGDYGAMVVAAAAVCIALLGYRLA